MYAVLGPFHVRRNGQDVDIGHVRQQALLAILVLGANRSFTGDDLVRAAWGDDAPSSGSKIIPPYIYRLRRSLGADADGDVIQRLRDGYQLRIDPSAVDVTAMESLVEQGRQARDAGDLLSGRRLLSAALSRWHGEPLSALPGPFLASQRRRLLEERLGVLEERIAVDLALGRHAEVIAELSGLVVDNPLREHLVGMLMLALYRSGRQAEALEIYQSTREALRNELGLDPGAELRRLHTDVLRADPDLAAPATSAAEVSDQASPLVLPPHRQMIRLPSPRRSSARRHTRRAVEHPETAAGADLPKRRDLPRDLSDFSGRSPELAAVTREDAPIVSITGMAGVGKTCLALRAAHLMAGRYPDGQVFLDLRGHTAGCNPMTTTEALGALLKAVGVPSALIPVAPEEQAALWRSQVAGLRLLIVLDNAVSTCQVRPLLPGNAMCRVVLTSRQNLSGVDSSAHVPLSGLTVAEGVTLLERIVGRERVAAEPGTARQLVELCDGLPLAVRIAGVRLRNRPVWKLHHLVTRMRGAERRLGELNVHDRSVADAFAVSYDRLGPAEQHVFLSVARLPGQDFDAEAAAVASRLPVTETEQVLETLLDANLLTQRRVDWFTLPGLLHGFAHGLARRAECRSTP